MRVVYPSQRKKPETRAHAGTGTTKKRRNLVCGDTHAKKDMTAMIAPIHKLDGGQNKEVLSGVGGGPNGNLAYLMHHLLLPLAETYPYGRTS